MNRPTHCLWLAGLFAAACLHAQAIREIEFSVYGQYPIRHIEYTPVCEAVIPPDAPVPTPVRIETHALARMGPHLFKGGDQISFYQTSGKERVAQVTLPPESNSWLLIFVKNPRYRNDPAHQLKYLIYPFDDSRRNLPKNGLVFLNLSGKVLEGQLQDRRVQLSAGESGRYRIKESLAVNLWACELNGHAWLPALIKTYHFQPQHRYLIILFPPVLRGSVDLDARFLSEALQ